MKRIKDKPIKLAEKVVYVYRTDDGIPYADLKKNRFEAIQCALKHIETECFVPSHILINDKAEIKLADMLELHYVKKDVDNMKANGIPEKDMGYFWSEKDEDEEKIW